MEIKSINYNWFATPENGEEFTNRTIGVNYRVANPDNPLICENIKEHPSAGEGDKWYYDISYSDGSVHRIFNVNDVYFQAFAKADSVSKAKGAK